MSETSPTFYAQAMSWRRVISVLVLLAGLGWMAWARGCTADLPDIEVADGRVHVRNNTGQEWRSVRIWVNEYYAVTVPAIPQGGFVREPIRRFVAAQGQTINTSTTSVTSVVVLATGPDGERIRLVWGTPQLH
jgi:hypothetical protein